MGGRKQISRPKVGEPLKSFGATRLMKSKEDKLNINEVIALLEINFLIEKTVRTPRKPFSTRSCLPQLQINHCITAAQSYRGSAFTKLNAMVGKLQEGFYGRKYEVSKREHVYVYF